MTAEELETQMLHESQNSSPSPFMPPVNFIVCTVNIIISLENFMKEHNGKFIVFECTAYGGSKGESYPADKGSTKPSLDVFTTG